MDWKESWFLSVKLWEGQSNSFEYLRSLWLSATRSIFSVSPDLILIFKMYLLSFSSPQKGFSSFPHSASAQATTAAAVTFNKDFAEFKYCVVAQVFLWHKRRALLLSSGAPHQHSCWHGMSAEGDRNLSLALVRTWSSLWCLTPQCSHEWRCCGRDPIQPRTLADLSQDFCIWKCMSFK